MNFSLESHFVMVFVFQSEKKAAALLPQVWQSVWTVMPWQSSCLIVTKTTTAATPRSVARGGVGLRNAKTPSSRRKQPSCGWERQQERTQMRPLLQFCF